MNQEERKNIIMNEVVNDRGETRREYLARRKETAKKLAAVLTESATNYDEVDSFFQDAKKLLYITDQSSPRLPVLRLLRQD